MAYPGSQEGTPMDGLTQALRLAGLGLHLFPVGRASKRPAYLNEGKKLGYGCVKGSINPLNNKKYDTKYFQNASTDPDQIRAWAHALPDCNWGIAPRDDELFLDIDGPQGRAILTSLEAVAGPIPRAAVTTSGRDNGGQHVLVRLPTGIRFKANAHIGEKNNALDTKTYGAFCVAPGSLHDTGRLYTGLDIKSREEIPVLTMAWVDALIAIGITLKGERSRKTIGKKPSKPCRINPYTSSTPSDKLDAIINAIIRDWPLPDAGQRDATLLRVSWEIVKRRLNEEDARTVAGAYFAYYVHKLDNSRDWVESLIDKYRRDINKCLDPNEDFTLPFTKADVIEECLKLQLDEKCLELISRFEGDSKIFIEALLRRVAFNIRLEQPITLINDDLQTLCARLGLPLRDKAKFYDLRKRFITLLDGGHARATEMELLCRQTKGVKGRPSEFTDGEFSPLRSPKHKSDLPLQPVTAVDRSSALVIDDLAQTSPSTVPSVSEHIVRITVRDGRRLDKVSPGWRKLKNPFEWLRKVDYQKTDDYAAVRQAAFAHHGCCKHCGGRPHAVLLNRERYGACRLDKVTVLCIKCSCLIREGKPLPKQPSPERLEQIKRQREFQTKHTQCGKLVRGAS